MLNRYALRTEVHDYIELRAKQSFKPRKMVEQNKTMKIDMKSERKKSRERYVIINLPNNTVTTD